MIPCLNLGLVIARPTPCPLTWVRGCKVHKVCTINNLALEFKRCYEPCRDYKPDETALVSGSGKA